MKPKALIPTLILALLFLTYSAPGQKNERTENRTETKLTIIKDQFIISFPKTTYKPFCDTEEYKQVKSRPEKAQALEQYNSRLQEKILADFAKLKIKGLKPLRISSNPFVVMGVTCDYKTAILIAKSFKQATVIPDVMVSRSQESGLTAERPDNSALYPVKPGKDPINQQFLEEIGAKRNSGAGKAVFIVSHKVLPHPDLNLDQNLSLDLVNSKPNLKTNGTPIAGIVAAKNNNIGLTGIAPRAKVISIATLKNNDQYTWGNLIGALSYITGVAKPGDCIVLDDLLNFTIEPVTPVSNPDPVEYLINEAYETFFPDSVAMNNEFMQQLLVITREMVGSYIQDLGMSSRYVSISAGGEQFKKLTDTFLGGISGPNIYYVAGFEMTWTELYAHYLFYIDNSVDFVASTQMWIMLTDNNTNYTSSMTGSIAGISKYPYPHGFDGACSYCPSAVVAGILLSNNGTIYHSGTLETINGGVASANPVIYTFRIASVR